MLAGVDEHCICPGSNGSFRLFCDGGLGRVAVGDD